MKIDNKANTQFVFSFARAFEAKRDIDLRIDALENRIENISRKIRLGEMPVMQMILQASHDPEELENLGNALLRVAKIIEPLDELRGHKNMIELAEKNRHLFIGLFGEFSHEMEGLDNVDSFLAETESQVNKQL